MAKQQLDGDELRSVWKSATFGAAPWCTAVAID